ncbi:NIPSNAP family protein [Phreatobacter stygius]|uniref:NIPSNAP family protein n=1 Tax=Phreatobacter stygius TaxID=1940610 RepID=A0A4D7BDD1_9HYPH|nr:NIPSNAP family protein [Phreatobacter stygius]QCI65947.1 NIPSNAP family protein [Phreatobacter stygius]
MLYELATLSIRLGTAAKAIAGIDSYVKEPTAKGRLLGCWASEIGELNRLVVLRGFADADALAAERTRTLGTTNPFHCGEALSHLRLESYAPFSFLPPVTTGKFGQVYEIRTYGLKLGGVGPTSAAWEAAMPERAKLSPLTIAMYALDGPQRFTHIWPYASLDARAAVRTESVAGGVWPPKGGPDWLTGEMVSTIGLPTAISPLA